MPPDEHISGMVMVNEPGARNGVIQGHVNNTTKKCGGGKSKKVPSSRSKCKEKKQQLHSLVKLLVWLILIVIE